MAKCLDCDCVYAVFGGSEGSDCPKCHSKNIDTSKEKSDCCQAPVKRGFKLDQEWNIFRCTKCGEKQVEKK